MAKIHVGGAGGAPANNFIRSLRESRRKDYLIGASCIPSDLFLANTDEKHVVPYAVSPDYPRAIIQLLQKSQPDFMHLQNDYEVRAVSRIRDQVEELGVKLFLPAAATIEDCVDKQKSYEIWRKAGIRVPETIVLHTPADLKIAFEELGPSIWIRATVGGGGRGALPTDSFEFAKLWVDRFDGWGEFTAAKCLTAQTVTWLSIWYEGKLIVAQTRQRRSWNFGNRTLSGVTGITGVAQTASNPQVDQIAQDCILAVDQKPHGIFGVDMTYDEDGFANPTEINIGRFFTTHYFFTKAGLNMPEIYCDIALEGKFPKLENKINPLPIDLVWIRGMDVEPVLTTVEELERLERGAR